MESRYEDALRDDVLRMIKFDHIGDQFVDAYYTLRRCFVILRNLVQNAVKHRRAGTTDYLFVDEIDLGSQGE